MSDLQSGRHRSRQRNAGALAGAAAQAGGDGPNRAATGDDCADWICPRHAAGMRRRQWHKFQLQLHHHRQQHLPPSRTVPSAPPPSAPKPAPVPAASPRAATPASAPAPMRQSTPPATAAAPAQKSMPSSAKAKAPGHFNLTLGIVGGLVGAVLGCGLMYAIWYWTHTPYLPIGVVAGDFGGVRCALAGAGDGDHAGNCHGDHRGRRRDGNAFLHGRNCAVERDFDRLWRGGGVPDVFELDGDVGAKEGLNPPLTISHPNGRGAIGAFVDSRIFRIDHAGWWFDGKAAEGCRPMIGTNSRTLREVLCDGV